MSRVLHLLTMDMRRMAPWILLWAGFLLTRTLLLRSFWKGGDEPPVFLEIAALHPWILLIVLVPLALQEDRPGGSRAFWLTRPIPGWEMAASKALLLTLCILLPMVATQTFALLDFGLAGSKLPVALADGILVELMVVAVLSILAMLTQGMSEYLLAFLSFFALNAAIVGVLSTASLLTGDGFGTVGRLLEGKDIALESALVLALSLVVLVHQYLTRRSGRSLALIGLAALVFFSVSPRLSDTEVSVALFAPNHLPTSDVSQVQLVRKRPPRDGNASWLFLDWPLMFEFEGLAVDADCARARFHGELRFQNGTTVRVREAEPLISSCSPRAVLSKSSTDLAVELEPGKPGPMEVGLIPVEDLDVSGLQWATLEGVLSVESLELRAGEARRPLAGEVSQQGARRLRFDRISYSEGLARLKVHARELGLRDTRDGSPSQLFLVNPQGASGSSVNPFEHLREPRRLLMARPTLWSDTVGLSTEVEGDRPGAAEELLLMDVELVPVAVQRARVRGAGAIEGIWMNWHRETSR